MSRAGIAFLAFRLLAIYFWIETLILGWSAVLLLMQVRHDPSAIDGELSGAVLASIVSAPVLFFVCGCLLFVWAPVFANKMFPNATAEAEVDAPGLGGLSLRVMGVLCAIRAMELIPGAARMQNATWGLKTWTPFAAQLLEIGVLALVSTWLIVFGPWIARWLLHEKSVSAPNPRSARFQAIAFAVIGVWLVASGLPQVIMMLASLFSRKMDVYNEALSSLGSGRWQAQQWISVCQVVAGVALFLGGRGLSALWHRIRTAGLGESHGETRERAG